MKTIMVLTDFSDYAIFALKVAANIARKTDAKINLVHVFNFPTAGTEQFHYYKDFTDEIKQSAMEQLNQLLELDFLKTIITEKFLITENYMWEIVNRDEFKNTSLIVIGSHGKSGFSRVFIGSNTDKIVRLANKPVLTIKKDIDNFNIKRFVFASDFEEESIRAFKMIRFFPEIYKAKIYLLKVITPSEFEPTPVSEKLLADFTKKLRLKNIEVSIYNSPTIETGINSYSHEINADMVAIPTHGRTGFAHLINGSIAETLAKNEPKPVLSIKIPDKKPSIFRTAAQP